MQNMNILTVGAKDGKGGFFPEGIAGRINTPEGFDALAEGIEDWDGKKEARQVGHNVCLTHVEFVYFSTKFTSTINIDTKFCFGGTCYETAGILFLKFYHRFL